MDLAMFNVETLSAPFKEFTCLFSTYNICIAPPIRETTVDVKVTVFSVNVISCKDRSKQNTIQHKQLKILKKTQTLSTCTKADQYKTKLLGATQTQKCDRFQYRR